MKTAAAQLMVALLLASGHTPVAAQTPPAAPGAARESALARLVAAYPDALSAIQGNDLVWRDGTRMVIDDGRGPKTLEERLAAPDIKDMLIDPYPAGPLTPPASGADSGRARNAAFFAKLYGDCRGGAVTRHLADVAWVPSHHGGHVRMTALQGAAAHLAAVSARLDTLPARFDAFLVPTAGSYTCRTIAGTERQSAHGYGIAIDIALTHAHYWRWAKSGPGGTLVYHNEIPPEIVAAFEAEGFIWGGRWTHYDTMHFEYRPELIARSP